MGNLIKSTLILAIVAFIASYALSHVNNITYPEIKRQEKEKQKNALTAVLPDYTITDEIKVNIDGTNFVYWIGEKKGRKKILRGFAFVTEKSGYSGPVKTMVGLDNNGKMLGISILQQSETPGLGARVTEIASALTFFQAFFGSPVDVSNEPTVPWFQEQFVGLDMNKTIEIVKQGDWNESMRDKLLGQNAVSAITGATITTRTVRDSLEKGIINFNKARKEKSLEGKK